MGRPRVFSDAERRERKRAYAKIYRSRPEVHERIKERAKEYASRPSVRKRMAKYCVKYNARPEVQERKKQRRNARYREDPAFRERMKQRSNCQWNDPDAIIKSARTYFVKLKDEAPEIAKELQEQMEKQEGKEFVELLLDGVAKKPMD